MWPHPVGLGPFGQRLDRLRSGLGRRWAARCRQRLPRTGEWRSSTLALDRSTRGGTHSWAEREAGRGGVRTERRRGDEREEAVGARTRGTWLEDDESGAWLRKEALDGDEVLCKGRNAWPRAPGCRCRGVGQRRGRRSSGMRRGSRRGHGIGPMKKTREVGGAADGWI